MDPSSDHAGSGPPVPPPPIAPRQLHRLGLPIAIAAVGTGLLANAALDGPPGLGLTILVATMAVIVVISCRARLAGSIFLAIAVVVSAGFAVRTSPTLVALIALTSGSLLSLGAAFSAGGQPVTTTVRGYVRRWLAALGAVPAGAIAFAAPARVALNGDGQISRGLVRSIMLIVPVVGVLVLLLGSADPAFAHYLRVPLEAVPGATPVHLARITLGALACSALLVRGARPVDTTNADAPAATPWPHGREWTTLVGIVVALFSTFVVVQLTVFFGGRTRVLSEQGLTYAENARSGFWQLLAAVAICGLVIAGAWGAGARRRTATERRLFSALAVTLICLVLVVLTSAFQRLTLYERAYGFTWPRLLVHTAIICLGLLLTCGGIAIVLGRARWLPTAMVAIGVLSVTALIGINPERIIAERNIERFHQTGLLDIAELSALSADAAPALVGALPSLAPCERSILGHVLAAEAVRLGSQDGWAALNVGRARARSSLDDLGALGAGGKAKDC